MAAFSHEKWWKIGIEASRIVWFHGNYITIKNCDFIGFSRQKWLSIKKMLICYHDHDIALGIQPCFFLEENWRFGTLSWWPFGTGWEWFGLTRTWCPLGVWVTPITTKTCKILWDPLQAGAQVYLTIYGYLKQYTGLVPLTMLSNEATRLTMAPSWPNPHLQSAANLISLEMGCHQSFDVPRMREEDLIATPWGYGQFGVQTLQKKVTFGRIPISLFKYFPDQQKNNVNPAFRNPLDPWSVWLGGIILVDYCYLRTPPNQLLNYWSGVDNVLTPTTCYPSLRFPIATFVRKRSSTGHGTARLLVNSSCWPTTFSPGTACAHLPVAVAANSRHLVPMGLEVLNQCVSCITLKNVIFDNTENVWKIGETANDLLYI